MIAGLEAEDAAGAAMTQVKTRNKTRSELKGVNR
jgi:hypothetical protein